LLAHSSPFQTKIDPNKLSQWVDDLEVETFLKKT
jgi:hypothetical protein